MSTTQVCQTLKAVLNGQKKDLRQVMVTPCSSKTVRFLKVMLKRGYIDGMSTVDNKRKGKIWVQLNGRLNKCKGISPAYSLTLSEIDKFKDTVLPSGSTGYLVLTTKKGIMDHHEAIKKKVGGNIMGFFF
eukprot:GAHX01000219.1.p1 GENE.GAHX01000219.1~~GAHX01000219.1.p1  ORF type:complete len:145 (-),score=28.49 GAHX01000219.1:44-433(-)